MAFVDRITFVDLSDFEDNIDFVLDEQGQRQAQRRLEMASNMAMQYAKRTWTVANVPPIVQDIVLNVVERFMRNPDAYTQSRAGDETVAFADRGEAGSWYFTSEEKDILAGFGPYKKPLGTIRMTPWQTRDTNRTIFVRTDPVLDGDLFPLFSADDPMLGGGV